ncbi:MAG: hypothetical protein AAFX76_10195 [Planctomycetota bacterium]
MCLWFAAAPGPALAQDTGAPDAGPVLLYSFDDPPKVFTLEGGTFAAENVIAPDHVGWRITGIDGDAGHNFWPLVDMTETFADVDTAAVTLKVNEANGADGFALLLQNNYAADEQVGLTFEIDLTKLVVGEVVTIDLPLPSPRPDLTQASTYKLKYYGKKPIDIEVYEFYLPGPDDASEAVDEPD